MDNFIPCSVNSFYLLSKQDHSKTKLHDDRYLLPYREDEELPVCIW